MHAVVCGKVNFFIFCLLLRAYNEISARNSMHIMKFFLILPATACILLNFFIFCPQQRAYNEKYLILKSVKSHWYTKYIMNFFNSLIYCLWKMWWLQVTWMYLPVAKWKCRQSVSAWPLACVQRWIKGS